MQSRWARLIIAFLLAASTGLPARGQTGNASVKGEVVDQQNSSVGGATVSLTRLSTHVRQQATTDAKGDFIFPPVVPGTYELKAEASGFSPTVVAGMTANMAFAIKTTGS